MMVVVFPRDWCSVGGMKNVDRQFGTVLVAMLLSLPVSAESELLIPNAEQLEAATISYDFDWRHAKINMEHDDLEYGLRLNKGEFSIGQSDGDWKTTFDIPDQQIKLEWGF